MKTEEMKALANSIMEQCQKQGLSYSDTVTLMKTIIQRVEEERTRMMEELGKHKMEFKPF